MRNSTITVSFVSMSAYYPKKLQKELIPGRTFYGTPQTTANPVSNYLLKVNNRNTRKRREICSKLTITTPE